MTSDMINKLLMLVIIGLLAVLIFSINSSRSPVIAGSSGMAAGGLMAIAANTEQGNRDLVYVIDTNAKSMAVYECYANRLNLVAARNIKFDLLLDEWRPRSQKPSVEEVYKETRKKIKGSVPEKKK